MSASRAIIVGIVIASARQENDHVTVVRPVHAVWRDGALGEQLLAGLGRVPGNHSIDIVHEIRPALGAPRPIRGNRGLARLVGDVIHGEIHLVTAGVVDLEEREVDRQRLHLREEQV